MHKKSYIFDYVALILGATIGAGFASGQEIVTFFARFGFVSVFFVVLFCVIFAYCLNLLLSFSKNSCYNNLKNNCYLNSILSIIFFMISANMLAGTNELLSDLIFNFNFPLYSILILFVSYLIINKGLKFIFKINKIIVPIMILITILVCFLSFFVSPHSNVSVNFDIANLAMLSTSCVLYTFCNVLVVSKIVLKAGEKIETENIKKVAIISSISLGTIVVLIILSLLINDNSILFSNMPIVLLAFLINKNFGYLYSLIIFFSILTTLLATTYSLTCNHKKKSKLIIYAIIFALSLFGFENLIEYTYPIIGAIGVIIVYKLNNLKLSNNIV